MLGSLAASRQVKRKMVRRQSRGAAGGLAGDDKAHWLEFLISQPAQRWALCRSCMKRQVLIQKSWAPLGLESEALSTQRWLLSHHRGSASFLPEPPLDAIVIKSTNGQNEAWVVSDYRCREFNSTVADLHQRCERALQLAAPTNRWVCKSILERWNLSKALPFATGGSFRALDSRTRCRAIAWPSKRGLDESNR
jgi:hypothetical protein